jgi:hypothetical protein
MNAPQGGICPVCGHAVAVTNAGRMRTHGGRRSAEYCPGSCQPAARRVIIPAERARAITDAFLDGAQDWRRRHWGARTKLTDTVGRLLAEGAGEDRIGRGLVALHGADDGPARLRSYTEALRRRPS